MEIQSILLSKSLNHDCVLEIQTNLCKLKSKDSYFINEIKCIKCLKIIIFIYKKCTQFNLHTEYCYGFQKHSTISNILYNILSYKNHCITDYDTISQFNLDVDSLIWLENDILMLLNNNQILINGISPVLQKRFPNLSITTLLDYNAVISISYLIKRIFKLWNMIDTETKLSILHIIQTLYTDSV